MASSTAPDARKPRVALFKALKLDNTTELQNLLSDAQLIHNVHENDLRELLGKAVGNGNEEAVKLLLQEVAKTDVTAGSGPLHRAIKHQTNKTRHGIIKSLLDHKCEIDFQNADGGTPLMTACLRSQDEIIKTFMD